MTTDEKLTEARRLLEVTRKLLPIISKSVSSYKPHIVMICDELSSEIEALFEDSP